MQGEVSTPDLEGKVEYARFGQFMVFRGDGKVHQWVVRNSFYQDFDVERLSGAGMTEGDYRGPFQVDRDRVLHTPAFRRVSLRLFGIGISLVYICVYCLIHLPRF